MFRAKEFGLRAPKRRHVVAACGVAHRGRRQAHRAGLLLGAFGAGCESNRTGQGMLYGKQGQGVPACVRGRHPEGGNRAEGFRSRVARLATDRTPTRRV